MQLLKRAVLLPPELDLNSTEVRHERVITSLRDPVPSGRMRTACLGRDCV